jgi:hypothetical protein
MAVRHCFQNCYIQKPKLLIVLTSVVCNNYHCWVKLLWVVKYAGFNNESMSSYICLGILLALFFVVLCSFVWSGAFMATMYNKIFSGYQLCQMVEWRKNQHFEDHLRPCPQGTEVAGVPICVIYIPAYLPKPRVHGCALANGDWRASTWLHPPVPIG